MQSIVMLLVIELFAYFNPCRLSCFANSKLQNAIYGTGIAIALGAALLTGGGGTLAYWSTNQTLQGTSISTGDFDLSLGDGEWTLTSDAANANAEVVNDISTVGIVPGDTLQLKQELRVTLVGENLTAELAIDTAELLTGIAGDNFTVTATLDSGASPLALSETNNGEVVEAVVTVEFDSATPDRENVDAHLKATIHGSGTNLRWKLQVAHKVDPAFKDHVTFQSWAGACGTGTSIQTNGYPSQGSMPPGQNVDICVRFTLNANAPSTLQGKTLGAKVVVTGLQAG